MYKISIQKCDPDKLAKFVARNKSQANLDDDKLEVLTVDLKKTAKALGTEIEHFKQCNNAELAQIIEKLKKHSVKSEEAKMPGENDYKVNFVAPKINRANNIQLEQSISALKLANSMGAVDEKRLIYLTLMASDDQALVSALNNEQLNSLDKFIAFLRECYGSSQESLKQLDYFESISQSESESDPIFFNRVFRAYFESRNATIPAIANASETDKYLIKAKFTQRVNSEHVRQKLVENFSSLDFAKLGTIAKNYREAAEFAKSLEQPKTMQVAAIHSQGRSFSRGRSPSRGRSYSRENRSKSRDRKQVNFDIRCYRCNAQGHDYKNCKTSVEKVQEFRNRIDFHYFKSN